MGYSCTFKCLDTKGCWTATAADAFETLKAAQTEAPVLAYPNLHCDAAPFLVQTDTSVDGLGAVLEQDDRVIAYASRALTKAEHNYSVVERECLVITYALKQFCHYLLGHKFHRSCPTPMAVGTEDGGGYVVPMRFQL